MVDRREFLRLTSLAAAGAFAGCASRRFAPVYTPDPNAFIKAALIHLGSNMWTDVYTAETPRKVGWDDKVRVDYLRAKDEIWRECTEAMAANGLNMVVIDLGEALAYPSHPELAVGGTWSVEKMRLELDRLRRLGLEPIPKINLSTTHNAWMKDWRFRVSTPEYLRMVDDLICDVAEIFDRPRFIHIGYDEETIGHQGGWGHYQQIIVRRGDLWWRDFLRAVATVRSVGCRPWCFSDQIWYEHDRFVNLMPRDVVMCPWNMVDDPKNPKYLKTIDEMAALGFDFIPDCSTYTTSAEGIAHGEGPAGMDYCVKTIPADQLKGFLFCPWVTLTPGLQRQKFLESMKFAGERFRAIGH